MTATHPELRQALERLPHFRIRRWMLPAMRRLLRFGFPKANLEGVELSEHPSEQQEAGWHVRILRPATAPPSGALLWFHGGGFVLGSPEDEDARGAELVRKLGIAVVAAHYRLAPAHPYPAALEDAHRAWRWLLEQLDEFGLEPSRLALGGQSAGGGLAASLAQRLRDEGGPQPACQLLVYPMLDDRTAAKRELDRLKHPVWNNGSNRTGWSAYLGRPPGAPVVPRYAVPARCEDLAGLPPAWIGVGDQDLFLEEARTYARRLLAAGVECELEVVEGAVHGFDVLAPQASISIAFTRSQVAFLARRLGLARRVSG